MFRKLVSNLPFSPSLVNQVSFYAKRMHEEATIRRAGFLLIALAMFIQMFAIIAPPEKSLAASNDFVINGLRTRTDIETAWNRAGSDIPAIYGKFGLTLADIQKLPLNPNTTIRSTSADWWTIGRNSLSNYSTIQAQYKASEIALQVSPSTTVYMRLLHAWDVRNPSNVYKAFTGTKASDGTQFWIMVDCGNYTQIGKYTPKTPIVELRKTIVGNPASLKPGDSFTFRFEYRNSVPDSLAEGVKITDTLDTANYDITAPVGLPMTGATLNYPLPNLSYTPNYQVLEITVRLKNPFPASKSSTCNAATLTSTNGGTANGGPVCVNVIHPCPYNPALVVGDAACKPPVAPCKYNPGLPENSPDCVPPIVVCNLTDTDLDKTNRIATFKTTLTSTSPTTTQVQSYVYDFGDKSALLTQNSKLLSDTAKHAYGAGTFTAKVAVTYTANGVSGAQKTACQAPITFDSEKPFGQQKKVKNITRNLEGDAAINTKLQAGDVLEYTLTTSNTQDFARKGVVISDYVGDILDYATLDDAFLQTQGGSYDSTSHKVSWSNVTLDANKDMLKMFRVTLKNPIPSTNQPSAVSGSFDCAISNKYGNEINMQVTCPVVKNIEKLPNTGPGSSAIMGFMITAVVGYFFARSRLLAKELDIIRSEYTTAGGF